MMLSSLPKEGASWPGKKWKSTVQFHDLLWEGDLIKRLFKIQSGYRRLPHLTPAYVGWEFSNLNETIFYEKHNLLETSKLQKQSH